MRVDPKPVDIDKVGEQPGSAGADGPVHLSVFGQNPERLVLDRRRTLWKAGHHPVHTAGEIHRGRPGRPQLRYGSVQPAVVPAFLLGFLDGEQYPERARRSQQRSTAHRQSANRID